MDADSDGRRLPGGEPARTPDCAIDLEGRSLPAVIGEPVAVSLLAAGVRVLSRSIKYHRPRAAFCLAGHCGSCLVRIDGVPNVKACRTPVSAGMQVSRQNSFPSSDHDLLGAADLLFPKGMDHHTMFTRPAPLNAMLRGVVRRMGGLGRLPDERPLNIPRGERRHVEVAIIGGGPAGLAAAATSASLGRRVLVLEEDRRAGGSLLGDPSFGRAAADVLVEEARHAGAEILTGATALGWYPEDDGGLLAVDVGGSLLRLTADRYLYATGGYDTNALFADNDRPGILAGRAVGALLTRYGIVVGRRVTILGEAPYRAALAVALVNAGCDVTLLDDRDRPVRAHGGRWISAITVEREGSERKIECDTVAVATLPAPASELPRQHGAAVALRREDGGFSCIVDDRGATAAPRVFACGDVCGYRGPAAAREHGAIVGRSIAENR